MRSARSAAPSSLLVSLRVRVSDVETVDRALRAADCGALTLDLLDQAADRHDPTGLVSLSEDEDDDGRALVVWQRQWEGDKGTDWRCETEWPRAEAERMQATARKLGLELEVVR